MGSFCTQKSCKILLQVTLLERIFGMNYFCQHYHLAKKTVCYFSPDISRKSPEPGEVWGMVGYAVPISGQMKAVLLNLYRAGDAELSGPSNFKNSSWLQ